MFYLLLLSLSEYLEFGASYLVLPSSLALFLCLAVVMFLTRNIDWYRLQPSETGEIPAPGGA